MAVVGIDLGTTNSLVTVWRDGSPVLIPNAFGELLTPSVVGLDDDGSVVVGKIAKERLVTHPAKTAASFKQFMGSDKRFLLGKKAFYPEDLSSLVLRQLKQTAEQYLGEEVTEAVVSVPAYFNNNQRSATKNAGRLAGLTVERIINEPSAAAIHYSRKMQTEGVFLVVDLGGGTLDISVVDVFENVIDIRAVAGDNHLGGDNFDEIIENAFYNVHPGLRERLAPGEVSTVKKLAQSCKIAFSSSDLTAMNLNVNGEIFSFSLTASDYTSMCGALLERVKAPLQKALRDCRMTINDINEVLLIGGSTKMPMIQKYIRYITGRQPVCDTDPDWAVALGVGIVTGIKRREGEIKDTVLVDICPFTLGTGVHNRADPTRDLMEPIIERNTSLPASREQILCTVGNQQKKICCKVYQGENLEARQNLYLGELEMPVPPLPAGEAKISCRFTYDINGILEIDLKCLNNGETAHKLIVQNGNLSADEIEKRTAELRKLKISPLEEDENKLLIARAEALFAETFGPVREFIAMQLQWFTDVLHSGKNISEIKKARRQFEEFLDGASGFDTGLIE